jgi:pimeloyl-ACP methyl ester carboxylesterase
MITRALALFLLLFSMTNSNADILSDVTHGYANNAGVKIHYATVGEGPLVVMIHGFPDYWYTWRNQMQTLKSHYKVVAMDQRGYNLSDQPRGDENYDMALLVADVAAVVKAQGRDRAIIVGHDWGGVVAWNFAFTHGDMVDKLIILNLPHPNGLAKVQRENPVARSNTDYARVFRERKPDDPSVFFGGPMNAQSLSGWVTDAQAREHYVKAFERSNFSSMLAYYKRNYPAPPEEGAALPPLLPNLKMPLLIFHGLQDTALHSDGLNNTWDWIDNDVTVVTAPNAGHFIQQDASDLVSSTMSWWLQARD